jgi:hypothetical protein
MGLLADAVGSSARCPKSAVGVADPVPPPEALTS